MTVDEPTGATCDLLVESLGGNGLKFECLRETQSGWRENRGDEDV